MAASGLGWREVGWNHIEFRAPPNWEPAEIGRHYMVFENRAGPALELKWARIKGTFNHKKHLKQLGQLYRKESGRSLAPLPVPDKWQKALAGFQASAFCWTGPRLSGKGVVLFCPLCRHATLIQLLYKKDRGVDDTLAQILAGFRDHNQKQRVLWTLYDMRAVMPQRYRLHRHRFEAGKFSLSFSFKKQHVTLFRWAAAAMLLQRQGLIQTAERLIPLPGPTLQPATFRGCEAVQWKALPDAGRPFHRLRRRFRRASCQALRLWHVKEKDRILGVHIEDNTAVEPHLLNAICRSYEIV